MAWWVYAGGAAALAGLGYIFWPGDDDKKHGHKPHGKGGADAAPDPSQQPPDQGAGDTPPAATLDSETDNAPVPLAAASPAPSTPGTTGFHPGPFLLPQAAQAVGLQGRAVLPARRLHDYFQRYGNGRNEATHKLVLGFQRAHNSDPLAIRLAGRLPNSGHFDPRTSATLTMYTGTPIPASPGAPAPPPPRFNHILNPNIPGNAAMAGYNVATDIRRRGVVEDDRQRSLIRDYQREINRDPKFPGPAWARETRPVLSSRIRENGRYTPEVARALAVQTHGAPPPPVR